MFVKIKIWESERFSGFKQDSETAALDTSLMVVTIWLKFEKGMSSTSSSD